MGKTGPKEDKMAMLRIQDTWALTQIEENPHLQSMMWRVIPTQKGPGL